MNPCMNPSEFPKQKRHNFKSITSSTNFNKPISNNVSETRVIRHISSTKNEEKSLIPSLEFTPSPITDTIGPLKLLTMNYNDNFEYSVPFSGDRNEENNNLMGKSKTSEIHESVTSNSRNKYENSHDSLHNIKRKAFTVEEDQILRDCIQKYGLDWEKITPHLPGRTLKQCHDRYSNYLRPSMKAKPWTPEEDQLLDDLFLALGKKWTKMTKKFPGRSSIDIKSRWEKNFFSRNHHSSTQPMNTYVPPPNNQNVNILIQNTYYSNRMPQFSHPLNVEQRSFNLPAQIKEHQVISNLLPAVSPTEQNKPVGQNKDNETIMRYCSQIQYNHSIWDGDEDDIKQFYNAEPNADKFVVDDKFRNKK